MNESGQLGLGDKDNRGESLNGMGDNLPNIDLGADRSVVSIAAGGAHSCALLDNAFLKCWGNNDYGQLGLGDTRWRGDTESEMGDTLPTVDLGSNRTAIAISAGSRHTCALLHDGSVKCWGYNYYGQLGLGDSSNRGDGAQEMGDALPNVALGTGRTAISISAGGEHSCALLDDGSVKCWGYNNYGQLGLEESGNRGDGAEEMGDSLPRVELGTNRTATMIAAGPNHSCAILDNGLLKCWGWNTDGQLGLGDNLSRGDTAGEMGDALPMVNLGTERTALHVAAGSTNTCALLNNGSIKCWGRNEYGQLGLGDSIDRGDGANEMGDALPEVNLGTSRSAIRISIGNEHSCALLDDATVKCWGHNQHGQLGLGDTDSEGLNANDMVDNLPTVNLGTNSRIF